MDSLLVPTENILGDKSLKLNVRAALIDDYPGTGMLIVVIKCSKKAPDRVRAAAKYSPIISKHRTQIDLSEMDKKISNFIIMKIMNTILERIHFFVISTNITAPGSPLYELLLS